MNKKHIMLEEDIKPSNPETVLTPDITDLQSIKNYIFIVLIATHYKYFMKYSRKYPSLRESASQKV